jgi:N-methylhydantoinase A
MSYRLGVDVGGTFTDVLLVEEGSGATWRAKTASTPADQAVGVLHGIEKVCADAGIDLAEVAQVLHGTTVATNAILEGKGATVGLVTTKGFRQVLQIARSFVPGGLAGWIIWPKPEPLADLRNTVEVDERIASDGTVIRALDEDDVRAQLTRLQGQGIQALAVSLINAFADPAHERRIAELAAELLPGVPVSLSSDVLPELREYERTLTTVANGYVQPQVKKYVQNLSDRLAQGGVAGELAILRSDGGLQAASAAVAAPVTMLMSGPAGGVTGAVWVAEQCGHRDLITFDMGGTSTDVALVLGGEPQPAAEREVAGYPIRLPSGDVHTIGAGGGSIARLDAGGALVVGPESAGAVPGPACYGLGGREPTVTDADLVAGRLPAGAELAGIGRLRVDAARTAFERAGVTAEGVIAVVDAAMEQALRTVSVERGVDPRRLALVAYGGAGPMHACGLADALGMPAVIIPPRAGVLSAVGLLCGPRQHDLVRSWPTPADHDRLTDAVAALAAVCTAELGGSGPELETAVDCRYAGQSHEITVASVEAFADEHWRRNGYDRPGTPIEVVALRATARRAAPLSVTDLPQPDRARPAAAGPAVLAEPDCTVWVPDGWSAEQGEAGALVLRRAR